MIVLYISILTWLQKLAQTAMLTVRNVQALNKINAPGVSKQSIPMALSSKRNICKQDGARINVMPDTIQIPSKCVSLVTRLALHAHLQEIRLVAHALRATSLNGWVSLVNTIVLMASMATLPLICACCAITPARHAEVPVQISARYAPTATSEESHFASQSVKKVSS